MFSEKLLLEAGKGNLEAMLDIANSYYTGANTSIDEKKAFSWYRNAYSLAPNNLKAINGLADCYRKGYGVEKDVAKAVELYSIAVSNNDAYALYVMGNFYFDGIAGEKNIDKAIEYIEKACELNYEEAMEYLYDAYLEKYGENIARIKYIDFLRLLASKNTTNAMTLLYREYIGDDMVQKDENTAWYYLNQAVERNCPSAICYLGLAYMFGEVEQLGKNEQKGKDLIAKAAHLNYERALYIIASLYNNGDEGYPKDIVKAKEYFERCIEIRGVFYSEALCDLGLELVDSENSIFDSERGISLLSKASELDDDIASNYLGYLYEWGRYVTADTNKAIEYYKKAVENNHARSQYRLGRLLIDGLFGAPKDEKAGIDLLEKAAAQGELEAMEDLGICAYQGKGMPVDLERARTLFETCAREGLPQSQYNFALMNCLGDGGPTNYKAAEYWYNKTIEQDVDVLTKDAKWDLAIMYSNHTKEYKKAFPLWTEFANSGNADAQYNLGLFYYNGWAVPKNENNAKYWFEQAANQGHTDAAEALKCLSNDEQVGPGPEPKDIPAEVSVFKKIIIFSTLFLVIGFLIAILISQDFLISLLVAYLVSVLPLSIMRLKGLKMSGGQAVMTAAAGYLANKENGCTFAIAFMLGRWIMNYLISLIISPFWYIKSIVVLIKAYSK